MGASIRILDFERVTLYHDVDSVASHEGDGGEGEGGETRLLHTCNCLGAPLVVLKGIIVVIVCCCV